MNSQLNLKTTKRDDFPISELFGNFLYIVNEINKILKDGEIASPKKGGGGYRKLNEEELECRNDYT